MSTYRSSAKRDAAVADDYLANHMACRACGAQTHRDELSAFGAQCKACFDAYCRAEQPRRPPPRTRQERERVLQGMRDMRRSTGGISTSEAATVAARLRALEASGMRLTDGQRWVLERCEAKAGMVEAAA